MNGLFSISVNSFHSAPNLFEISELCIFGLSSAIFRRCIRDQTMNAFIGLFMWLSPWDASDSPFVSIRNPNGYPFDIFLIRTSGPLRRTAHHPSHWYLFLNRTTTWKLKVPLNVFTCHFALRSTLSNWGLRQAALGRVSEGGATDALPTHQYKHILQNFSSACIFLSPPSHPFCSPLVHPPSPEENKYFYLWASLIQISWSLMYFLIAITIIF